MSRVQSIQANILNIQLNKVKAKKAVPNFTSNTEAYTTNPLRNYLDVQAAFNKTMVKPAAVQKAANVQETAAVAKVEDKKAETSAYKNNLRSMLQNGESKILAIVPRTFNAKDENGDEKITGKEDRKSVV